MFNWTRWEQRISVYLIAVALLSQAAPLVNWRRSIMVAMFIIMLAGGAIDTRRDFIEDAHCEAAKAKIIAEFYSRGLLIRAVITCIKMLPE
jgi:hypothetical protein